VVCWPGRTVSAEELRHFASSKLSAFKVPRTFVFSDRPLPRSSSGKVLKSRLAG
jgi:acyl-CoA synthetase (AMP-forming)/AMP-acid ligase II